MKKNIFVILFLIIPAFLFSEDPPPAVSLSLGAVLADSSGLKISVTPETAASELDLTTTITGEEGDELLIGTLHEEGGTQDQWEVYVRTANGYELRGSKSWNDAVVPYELRIEWSGRQGGGGPHVEEGDTGYFSQTKTIKKEAKPLDELDRTIKIRYAAEGLMLPADTYQDTIIFTISNM